MSLQLSDGDRVIIVGGGPAGCFAGLHLQALARQKGLTLDILLFEPRDFALAGPGGCNRCAGILSSRLVRGLKLLQTSLPPKVIQAEIHAYRLDVGREVICIDQPDSERTIISVYRAGGPRLGEPPYTRGFDGFLLDLVCRRGATRVRDRVQKITWEGRPVAHTREKAYEADFLVLATGVNSRPPLDAAYGYQAPETTRMVQDEFLAPPDWPEDKVHVYFKGPPGLKFGAFIPKGRYVNVSLLGKGLRLGAIRDFLAENGLDERLFPAGSHLCGCTPRIAVGPARHYYGDRWVAVGDAAVARLYKDGIGSSFFTSQAAMETAMNVGISRRAFDRRYRPYCRRIHRDNQYGRLLFALWGMTMHAPALLRAWMQAVRMESALPSAKRIHIRILWGMLTGDDSYRTLFWLSLTPSSFVNLARGLKRSLGDDHESIIGATD